jgi:hypothetical protein
MSDLDALRAAAGIEGRITARTTGVKGGDHWYLVADREAVAWISANDGEDEELRQPRAELIAASVNALPRIEAALTELVHHGDLTPSGRSVLERIIGGAS